MPSKTRSIVWNRWLRAVAVTLVVALAGSAAAEAGSQEWRAHSVWDDGNAEFCAYEIEWSRYGRLNEGTALLIAVKEPWASELEVKADSPRPDGFEVIKLNHIRDVPTGIYTYHQMASAFVRRDSGALRKLAVTSSEGCGISTASLTRGKLEARSYFDGQGDREIDYPAGALPTDALGLVLRDYVSGPLPADGSVSVFPSLMTGRFPPLEARGYEIRRTSGQRGVPAGSYETVEIELASGSRSMTFSFAAEVPHPLVRYQDSGGTTYRLAKCERIPYWQLNGPDGGQWLPKALR